MDPGWIAAIVAAAVAAGTFLVWLIRLLWHTLQRTIRFLDDYFGRAAEGDNPGRTGVMARLTALEEMARTIKAETQPNGGSSLRDVVHRIAEDVADVKDEQARLRTQMEIRRTPPRGRGQQ